MLNARGLPAAAAAVPTAEIQQQSKLNTKVENKRVDCAVVRRLLANTPETTSPTSSIRLTTPFCIAETLFPGSSRNLQTISVAIFFGNRSLYLGAGPTKIITRKTKITIEPEAEQCLLDKETCRSTGFTQGNSSVDSVYTRKYVGYFTLAPRRTADNDLPLDPTTSAYSIA